jgi:hypothetical protein
LPLQILLTFSVFSCPKRCQFNKRHVSSFPLCVQICPVVMFSGLVNTLMCLVVPGSSQRAIFR